MSNEPAFPTVVDRMDETSFYKEHIPGMSLRDYFAAQALQGMLANDNMDRSVTRKFTSVSAYRFADAMMKARGENT